MAIVSTATYKTWRGISGSTYDAQLDLIIPAAQAAMERHCNRLFDTATYTEKLSGNGSDRIVVRNGPIASVTSVTVYSADRSSSTALTADTDYTFTTDASGIINRTGAATGRFPRDDFGEVAGAGFGTFPCWPAGFENITVVYVGGYSAMPADLVRACVLYASDMLSELTRSATAGDYQSERLGDYAYTRFGATEHASKIRELLRPFVRVVL